MDTPVFRFDGWVLEVVSGELARRETRVRLQEQVVRFLVALLERPGTVVTREQLIAQLWPQGVVDFDAGLNSIARKLRAALGDTADTPLYIETLPRRGYRYVGPEVRKGPAADPPDAAVAPAAAAPFEVPAVASPAPPIPPLAEPAVRPIRRWTVAAAMGVLVVGAVVVLLARRPGAAGGPVGSADSAAAAPVVAALPAKAVAVLPFENLSAKADNEYLALGIAEMVMHRLAATSDLTVIARSSSFSFRNRSVDAREVGRALDARYLVTGTLQREGNRLRVTSELVDATTGSHVWSLSFDRRMDDLFALQDEIANRVCDALSVSLEQASPASPQPQPVRLDAYLAYLQGRALVTTGRIEDAEAAIARFAQAVALDPGYGAAYAQESLAISTLAFLREVDDPKAKSRARALNDQALRIDPGLGEAWVQRANLREPETVAAAAVAEAEYRKGLALAPNYGQGYLEFTEFLETMGRIDDALAMIERARQLDPLMPRNHYYKGVLLLFNRGDYAGAEAMFLRALQVNPRYHPALARLASLRVTVGAYAEADRLAEQALAIDPQSPWVRSAATMGYLETGDLPAARDLMSAADLHGNGLDSCVLFYAGDLDAAANAGRLLQAGRYWRQGPGEAAYCAGLALRDQALRTRDSRAAIDFYSRALAGEALSPEIELGLQVAYELPRAEVLAALGETEQAQRAARRILDRYRIPPAGSESDVLVMQARAHVLLGEREEAMHAMLEFARRGNHWGWWMLERDPATSGLLRDPRLVPWAERMRANVKHQAELAATMRRDGRLPARPAAATAATRG